MSPALVLCAKHAQLPKSVRERGRIHRIIFFTNCLLNGFAKQRFRFCCRECVQSSCEPILQAKSGWCLDGLHEVWYGPSTKFDNRLLKGRYVENWCFGQDYNT